MYSLFFVIYHINYTGAHVARSSVDLLNVGATSTAARRGGRAAHSAHVGHAAGHASRGAAGLVQLGHDRHGDALKLLLARLELLDLGRLVGLNPRDGLVDLLSERLLVGGVILVVDLLARALVLLLEALSLLHHALDLVLRQAALVVGDGDLVRLAGRFIRGRHVHDADGVK